MTLDPFMWIIYQRSLSSEPLQRPRSIACLTQRQYEAASAVQRDHDESSIRQSELNKTGFPTHV